MAVIAHAAGNQHGIIWPTPTWWGVLFFLAGITATALIVQPRRSLLLVLSILIPLTVALELPTLGNHWLLAGLVSLCWLLAGGKWERFEPGARVLLLVFYSFAAFAKLNTGFLDPSTSCGVVHANQLLDGFGLSTIEPSGPLGWAAAWGAALVELSVPVLLVVRKTRVIGVLLAVVFHGLISLDQLQHFYDFTAVLLPLFILFLPDSFFERILSTGRRLRRRFQLGLAGAVVMVGVTVIVADVLPFTEHSAWWLWHGTFFWWAPYLVFIGWHVARTAGPGEPLHWRLAPATTAVVALAFMNGLTPYLEAKTANSWNMYSNLVTVDGESNHLLVRSTLPLRERHPPVEIVETDDPNLSVYAETGYLLPWASFTAYLATRAQIRVVYRSQQRTYSVSSSNRSTRDPPWSWRWLPLRSVHRDQPDRCQVTYLPLL